MIDDDSTGAESDRVDKDTFSDADAGTETGMNTGGDTPVFDATVQALAAAPLTDDATGGGVSGVTSAVEHIDTDTDSGSTSAHAAPPAGAPEDPAGPQHTDVDWVDQRHGDPWGPSPVVDPDSPEGAAIVALFRRIKNVEEGDGSWPGGDVVDELNSWFSGLGIDPDEHATRVGHRLRLALRERPGGGLASAVYGVRISTDHDDPEAPIRTALHVLSRQLGPGTSIELVSHDRDLLARIEHRPDPKAGS